MRLIALLIALAAAAPGATRLLVTVVEQKTGKPVNGLKAEDFRVYDDRTPRRVESAEVSSALLDVMLLLDTSLVGGMVQPVAENLIEQLQPKDQMAIVSFHSAADLIQDFTSSKDLLRRALAGVRYGNTPRLLDALYASIDGGFNHTGFRRVLLLLTTGVEGYSRVTEREVLRLARSNAVSIYPIYVVGTERSLFETLARQTAGASFNLRDMRRHVDVPPGRRIFEAVRSPYSLMLSGNLSLGEKIKVEIQRPGKFQIGSLPLD